MKRLTFVVFSILLSIKAFSISDKIKLGITVSPGISWMKPTGKEISNGVAGLGLQYGLKFEYYFKDQNYAISSGLFGGIDGAGLHGRDTFTSMAGGKSVLERYNINYFMIPAYLKLKTNPIKSKYIVFGELGFQNVFNVSARANYDNAMTPPGSTSSLLISKENILRDGNDVQKLISGFKYHIYDFRLSVGGGFEYIINDKTTVFFAVHYHNGFITTMNDAAVNPKNDAIVARNVLFTFGAMF